MKVRIVELNDIKEPVVAAGSSHIFVCADHFADLVVDKSSGKDVSSAESQGVPNQYDWAVIALSDLIRIRLGSLDRKSLRVLLASDDLFGYGYAPALELIPLADHGPYRRCHSKLEARRTYLIRCEQLQETFSGS